uniref:Variable lymphocyte receptor n=1 Tax=Petromyzon marinus TaxID=7757 RepID=UPI000195C298|nr:Chain A, Variable lymphocyte receptor [Petromyzon marinus]2R9U_B Chain B, Variable lymphocyte receptor [Petromyzon marinus]2R9U_C Chain C, Variable lymphocyte receptor [Petromyzon marinus]2R9U_D Chain D, Variable lymphocyte receptor [Petromyzon marinus]
HHSAGCPSQCSCDQTLVNCQNIRLASVPAGIPTDKQRLWLNNNQITKLEPGVFDHLVNLQQLYFNSNKLTAIPTGVFDKLTQLTQLDLNDNHLKSIPRGAFDNLKSLTHIYLYNNPWDCECRDIMYLRNWVADHTSIVMRWDGKAVNDPDSAKCAGTNTPVRAVTEASTSPSKC